MTSSYLRLAGIGAFSALSVALIVGLIVWGTAAFAAPALQTSQVPLQELADELTNDPQGVGYVSMTHFEAANALNEVGLTGETVDVETVSADEMQAAVVGSEYLALAQAERDLWAALLSAGTVQTADTEIRGQVTAIWGPGTTTRSNLAALQTRSASRAEALWGDGAAVTDTMVEEARLLP